MEAARHKARQGAGHARQHDNEDGASRAEGAVHGQIRDVKDFVGQVDADGQDTPDQPLGQGARKLIQKIGDTDIHKDDLDDSLVRDGHVGIGHHKAEFLADLLVIHFGKVGRVFDRHLGDVGLAGQDLQWTGSPRRSRRRCLFPR